MANSADERAETALTVRGRVRLRRWDPLDGSIGEAESEAVTERGEPCTRVRLKLEPVRAAFLVGAAGSP